MPTEFSTSGKTASELENDALRAHLAENALVRARTFTWSRAARLTLRHLEGMLRPDES